MSIEIREIRPEEQEESLYIGRQAFAHGRRVSGNWFQDPNRPTLTAMGLWDEAGLQARLNIIAYQVHLGPDIIVPMGGLGGVSCLPASRGKGYAGALLKVTLERMRDAGQVISSLYPFSWDFYRHYGWEWVGLNRTYTVPTRILKASPETKKVRAAKTSDRPQIEKCYAQFAGRYRGLLVRDEKRWNALLDDTEEHFTYTYLYEHEGEVEGYLTFRGGKSEGTELNDFLALTPRARAGMLGLLRRHEMQTDKFTWSAPDNDPLYHQLCHNDVETKLEPMTQGRIVDVAGALRAWQLGREATGVVTLGISDEHAPWNTGTWRVDFDEGHVAIQKTDAAPQLEMTIQTLSQAYYGTPTVAEIREAQHMAVYDERGYETFCQLFAGPSMWTCDGF